MSRRAKRGAIPVARVQCETCIFRTDGKQTMLRPGRMGEILTYLFRGTPHICHTEGAIRACRGGRDFQLTIWHRLGLIPSPTDSALADEMVKRGFRSPPSTRT